MILSLWLSFLGKDRFLWRTLKKASPSEPIFEEASRTAPPRWSNAAATVTIRPQTENWSSPLMRPIFRWIFESDFSGNSLGKIAATLEGQSIPSPTSKPKWNREVLNKLLSNEKYTGRVLLQKTISIGGSKIKNNGFMDRYFYGVSAISQFLRILPNMVGIPDLKMVKLCRFLLGREKGWMSKRN